jgi:hypothetical protein
MGSGQPKDDPAPSPFFHSWDPVEILLISTPGAQDPPEWWHA